MLLLVVVAVLLCWLQVALGKVWYISGPCEEDQTYPDCVTSDNFPYQYSRIRSCTINLKSSIGQRSVEVLDADIGYHDHFFWDESGHHTRTNVVRLQGRNITGDIDLRFVPGSWNYRNYAGWRICALENDKPPWVITGQCQRDESDPDCITSAYYPTNYDNNDRCYMRMFETQARVLEVTAFDTEYRSDTLSLNGPHASLDFSGTDLVGLDGFRVNSSMNLTWASDGTTTSSGWRICARRERVWEVSGNCSVEDTDARCIVGPPDTYWNRRSVRSWNCSMRLVGNLTRMLRVEDFSGLSDLGELRFRQGSDQTWTDVYRSTQLQDLVVDDETEFEWGAQTIQGEWKICAGPVRPTTTTITSTTSTTTQTWSSRGRWRYSGNCVVDWMDRDCIRKQYSWSSGPSYCSMQLLGEDRLLKVTKFQVRQQDGTLEIPAMGISSVASYDPGLLHGAVLNGSTYLYWTGSYGSWRICARPLGTWNVTTKTSRAWIVNGSCEIDQANPDCVTTPNFGRYSYPGIHNCTMQPRGNSLRTLNVTSFRTKYPYDKLRFENGGRVENFSGSLASSMQWVLVNGSARFTWRALDDGVGYSDERQGWRICAPALQEHRFWAILGDCQIDSDDQECVTSPNFPNLYGSGDCAIWYRGAEPRLLAVTSFDTSYSGEFKVQNVSSSGYRSSPSYSRYRLHRGLQGSVANQNVSIHWHPICLGCNRRGWRVCARTPESWKMPSLVDPSDLQVEEGSGSSGIFGLDETGTIVVGTIVVVVVAAGCTFLGYAVGCCSASEPAAAAGPKVADTKAKASGDIAMQCRTCGVSFMLARSSSALRVNCPLCMATNEFSITPDVAATTPPEAELPEYWTSNRSAGIFSGMVTEADDVEWALQFMLDRTWKPKVTRDRGRENQLCKFEVVMVHRNENLAKWDRYARARAAIASQCAGCRVQHAKTAYKILDDPDGCAFIERAKLDAACNELYLFHGTKPSAAKAICENSFELSMAGSNAGTLYGRGLYFAEASSKSDEYAEEDREGIFAGLYAMLVCRVVCGDMNYTDEARPDREALVDSIAKDRTKHSILGDREKLRGTYREFVVFDRDQVYPEFVIVYRRVPLPATE